MISAPSILPYTLPVLHLVKDYSLYAILALDAGLSLENPKVTDERPGLGEFHRLSNSRSIVFDGLPVESNRLTA
jgi:hypothetical protein